MSRIIFVTGGVVSSLGKGLAAASLGALLQARGFSVRLRKADGYLNVDAGVLSPNEHGEVFVTEDGTEADLDLGHYERFTNVSAGRNDSTTSGRIYLEVLSKERRGDYQGQTIQVIPHVTGEIQRYFLQGVDEVDFTIIEIGGTAGDLESGAFFESVRQITATRRGRTALVHLTYLPYISAAGELKTKPTQHSVRDLQSIGLVPDVLLCRTEHAISQSERRKLALFCNVPESAVIQALDVGSIYDVPLSYSAEGLDREVLLALGMDNVPAADLGKWEEISRRIHNPEGAVTVGVIGKYSTADAYKSLTEALIHGGLDHKVRVDVQMFDAEDLETGDVAQRLSGVHGVLVPGGFGVRGTEGKINAIRFARERKIPYFGVCLGMQLATIEAVRALLELPEASSTEFGPTEEPVVGLMSEWMHGDALEERVSSGDMGGTLRLGAYPTLLRHGSLAHAAYGELEISERHRHRYEVNTAYRDRLEQRGFRFSGMSPDNQLPEIVELEGHPWFVGVQFHPELKSRPFAPHPLFSAFVGAALEQSRLV